MKRGEEGVNYRGKNHENVMEQQKGNNLVRLGKCRYTVLILMIGVTFQWSDYSNN